MPTSKIQANWTAVAHGSSSITRVTSVTISQGGTLATYSADGDRFPTVVVNLMNKPKATVTTADTASTRARLVQRSMRSGRGRGARVGLEAGAQGGDLAAHWTGQDPHATLYDVDEEQDAFDLAVARIALDRGLPLLAICRGLQVVNAAQGGTLVQDMDELYGEGRHHRNHAHVVSVEAGSELAAVVGEKNLFFDAIDRDSYRDKFAVKDQGHQPLGAIAPISATTIPPNSRYIRLSRCTLRLCALDSSRSRSSLSLIAASSVLVPSRRMVSI